jgi:D-amino-acid dehydrogenase
VQKSPFDATLNRMKVIVIGAGIIGVSTAWHLLERGHEVTVVERQSDAAMETSFANAGQISVSYCEPWASREAPLKALKWMFSPEAPLLFRPQWPWGDGWRQWRWGLQFLAQCNDAAFERNVQQIVALGAYSHVALKELVHNTGIEYQRLERGIAHFFTDQKSFESAGQAAALMRQYGVARRLISRGELLKIEPAFTSFSDHIVGATYTPTDESGDARLFTQELAKRCIKKGAKFLYGTEVAAMQINNIAMNTVAVRACQTGVSGQNSSQNRGQMAAATPFELKADAFVAACGSYTAPLLRKVGVDLPIYPGKGYSATFKILRPELAPQVSTIDDERKIAMTRLGDELRVAGTIEVGDYNLRLDTPLAQARCNMLARRVEQVLPGVCDTRSAADGGEPRFWTGLRPATPTNIPFIGKTKLRNLWVNAGHGTLGWTHGAGSGKALAELISGGKPDIAFKFYGF